MSTPSRATVTGRTLEGDPAPLADVETVLDLLGDRAARRILEAAQFPRTVDEFVEILGLSRSTAYRKVDALEEAGLLRVANPPANGTTATRYRATLGELTVTLRPEVGGSRVDGR